MQTYTLLFRDPADAATVRAISFTAQTAGQAVRLVRDLPVRETCELWTEGRYVCSLRLLRGRSGWALVSAECLEVDIELEAEVQTGE